MSRSEWTAVDAERLRASIGQFVRVARQVDLIPRPQAAALGYLDREGPLSIAELADRAQVRHQSMRKTVRALSENGSLATAGSPDDGRKVLCSITRRGRTRLDQEREARAKWILDAIGRLSADDQQIALRIAGIFDRLVDDGEPDRDGQDDTTTLSGRGGAI